MEFSLSWVTNIPLCNRFKCLCEIYLTSTQLNYSIIKRSVMLSRTLPKSKIESALRYYMRPFASSRVQWNLLLLHYIPHIIKLNDKRREVSNNLKGWTTNCTLASFAISWNEKKKEVWIGKSSSTIYDHLFFDYLAYYHYCCASIYIYE